MKNLLATAMVVLASLVIGNSLPAQTASIGSFNNLGPAQSMSESDTMVSLTAEAQGLQLVSPDQLPKGGTFWLCMAGGNGINILPVPCPPVVPMPIYDITGEGDQFLVDGTVGSEPFLNAMQAARLGVPATAQSALTLQANAVVNLIEQVQARAAVRQLRSMGMAMDAPSFGDIGDGGDDDTPLVLNSYPTNGLWLEMAGVTNGLAYVSLNSDSNLDYVYEIFSKTDLTATNWNIETEVFPPNPTNQAPFTVPMWSPTNLFIWARDWTGVDDNSNSLPDWWEWKYFGNFDQTTHGDYDGDGNDNLFDYEHNQDPNQIQFGLAFTNDRVTSSPVNGTLTILTGVPFYGAVLVNDTNLADADWQPFTTSNVVVNLNAGDGLYMVNVGLRGLPADAKQTWQTRQFILASHAPVLAITNPAGNVVSQSPIQLQGYANETLSSLVFDVSNATGLWTNQTGYLFVTNSFQCPDLALADGTNLVTLHAFDLAGNETTTNVSLTLNRAGDTNPPVLTVLWPADGTYISGSQFTLHGQVNDKTATVTAQIVDGGGNTNTAQGLVEWNGQVWVNGLPLGAGTNHVIVTATDPSNNVSVTTLTVFQSSVMVTMNPLSSDQLNQSLVNVTGTVSDPTDDVWVNGVEAYYLDDEGDWEADGVPVNPGGSANFDVEVYVGDPISLGSQFFSQPQPAMVALMSYSGHRHEYSYDHSCPTSEFPDDWGADDDGEAASWNYSLGGSDTDSRFGTSDVNPPYHYEDLTSLSAGEDAIAPPWEYANVNTNETTGDCGGEHQTERRFVQTQLMIEPPDQEPPGTTNTYVILASAAELSALPFGFPFYDLVAGYDGYAGDVPLSPGWLQINGTNLMDTGITNDDGTVMGLAVVEAPSGQPVNATPVATQFYTNDDYTFNAQVAKLEIVDGNSGKDLTTQTNTVIVGQQMNLICQLALTNVTLTNFAWIVPGYAISNFVVAADSSSATVATNFPLNNSNAVFYWVDGASNRIVQCSTIIQGKTNTVSAVFNVLRPAIDFTGSIDSGVAYDTNYFASSDGLKWLHFGGYVSNGVTVNGINCLATNVNLYGINEIMPYGFLAVQTIFSDAHALTKADGSTTTTNKSGLDNFYPTKIMGDGDGVIFSDLPAIAYGSTVLTNVVQFSTFESFRTVIMFQGDGIPIPIKEVDWNWSGVVSLTNSQWALTSSNATITVNNQSTLTFPAWTNVVISSQ